MTHMRYVVFWVVVVFFAFNDGVSGLKDTSLTSEENTSHHIITKGKSSVVAKRQLRFNVVVGFNENFENDETGADEERGVLSRVLVYDKPDKIFESLGLGIAITQKQLSKWLKYCRAYQKKNEDYAYSNLAIFYKLEEVGVPEVKLAEMLQLLTNKSNKDLKEVAKGVQLSQFGKWIDDSLELNDVKTMLGLNGHLSPTSREVAEEIFREFSLYYSLHRPRGPHE